MSKSVSERSKEDEVLTTREVAKMLRVHVYTVHDLLVTGRLKGFKIRRRWRILKTEVTRFMHPLEIKKE